ncbi:uncharacterized protein [Drosophila tropicalis]|uniref:uncharacterized protein n=1 Tax=Drosophila tropicalis TaxID=46794 RepID=UPI0035AC1379
MLPGHTQFQIQVQLLLVLMVLGIARGQRLPARQLQTPNFDGGESFERFESLDSNEMREELKKLLADQLTDAFAPLTTGQLRRQPAIVAPGSSAEALARFADDSRSSSSSEENEQQLEQQGGDSGEEEAEEPAIVAPSYNPWRDNFYDLNEDGSYVYGYSLPNGVRRWEHGYYSEEQHGQIVEGFYTQPRLTSSHDLTYELRCYRSDINGYHPFEVKYLKSPPRVQRDEQLEVDCFRTHRKR